MPLSFSKDYPDVFSFSSPHRCSCLAPTAKRLSTSASHNWRSERDPANPRHHPGLRDDLVGGYQGRPLPKRHKAVTTRNGMACDRSIRNHQPIKIKAGQHVCTLPGSGRSSEVILPVLRCLAISYPAFPKKEKQCNSNIFMTEVNLAQ